MGTGAARNAQVDARELGALRERARPVSLAADQLLAVEDAFAPLLPQGGLQRGTMVATGGCAPLSLALALLARASAQGSWVAAVGFAAAGPTGDGPPRQQQRTQAPPPPSTTLGIAAAAELGINLERLVLVNQVPAGQWATVVATMAEAFDAVVLAPPPVGGGGVRLGDARRLQARVRERGSVLVQVAWPSRAWPDRLDLELATEPVSGLGALGWDGIGDGYGHLQGRQVSVCVAGRRAAARPRRATLWLPGRDGRVASVDPRPSAPALSLVQAS